MYWLHHRWKHCTHQRTKRKVQRNPKDPKRQQVHHLGRMVSFAHWNSLKESCTKPLLWRSSTSWRRQRVCFTAVCSKCRLAQLSDAFDGRPVLFHPEFTARIHVRKEVAPSNTIFRIGGFKKNQLAIWETFIWSQFEKLVILSHILVWKFRGSAKVLVSKTIYAVHLWGQYLSLSK